MKKALLPVIFRVAHGYALGVENCGRWGVESVKGEFLAKGMMKWGRGWRAGSALTVRVSFGGSRICTRACVCVCVDFKPHTHRYTSSSIEGIEQNSFLLPRCTRGLREGANERA